MGVSVVLLYESFRVPKDFPGRLACPVGLAGIIPRDVHHGPGEDGLHPEFIDCANGAPFKTGHGPAVDDASGAGLQHLNAEEEGAQVIAFLIQAGRGQVHLLFQPGNQRMVVDQTPTQGAEHVIVGIDKPWENELLAGLYFDLSLILSYQRRRGPHVDNPFRPQSDGPVPQDFPVFVHRDDDGVLDETINFCFRHPASLWPGSEAQGLQGHSCTANCART